MQHPFFAPSAPSWRVSMTSRASGHCHFLCHLKYIDFFPFGGSIACIIPLCSHNRYSPQESSSDWYSPQQASSGTQELWIFTLEGAINYFDFLAVYICSCYIKLVFTSLPWKGWADAVSSEKWKDWVDNISSEMPFSFSLHNLHEDEWICACK